MDSHSQRRRLRTPAAAQYLGLSKSTLEKDRLTGTIGIPYLKLGPKIVAYDTADLDAWLATRRRRSTSDPGPRTKAVADTGVAQ